MKKYLSLTFCFSSLLLTGCTTGNFVHTTEPRSTVYIGQPAADVYENFGRPTKKERISENEQILIYSKQEIEKDWAYRYLHSCELKFFMKDDRVVDWSSEGDMCAISSLSGDRLSSMGLYNVNLPAGSSFATEAGLPTDAFRDSLNQMNISVENDGSFLSENVVSQEEGILPVFDEVEESSDYDEVSYGRKNRVFIGKDSQLTDSNERTIFNGEVIPADAF